jgi:hypothetical protein
VTAIFHGQLGTKNWPDAILTAQLGKAHRCTDIVMVRQGERRHAGFRRQQDQLLDLCCAIQPAPWAVDMEMYKSHGLINHPCQVPKLPTLPQLCYRPWHGFDTVNDVIRGAIECAPQNLLLTPAVVNKPNVIGLVGCIFARALIVCREAYQVETDIYPL